MSDTLRVSLENRQNKIQIAKDYLEHTQKLFNEFGSAELKTSHAKFNELLNALNSDSVRLVVLGEFSRGKSSLVNALLGIELLPTALQATTAINTFVQMLPVGHADRFIRIHYQDDRPCEDIPWNDDAALESWGTELDESNSDARKTVDFIEAFMSHPLLEKGLVLVDTPGLESVMEHHEAITRKAIAEAHIALWVQNTTQLGGAATEWRFLADTISNNFRKFVTVISWWDKVIEPDDKRERDIPLKEREKAKLDVVKQNFKRHLNDEKEVEQLTNSDHLLTVSAHWAMSDDENKKRNSGIDVLSKRIAEMFSSGEALEQIYSKPLQQLSHIQSQLADNLKDELEQLALDKTFTERTRDIEKFDLEIKLLKQDAENVSRDSTEEHQRVSNFFVAKVKDELIIPLVDLKNDIENQIDLRYVKCQIDKRVKTVELPENLHTKFHLVTTEVAENWNSHKNELSNALEGLSVDYSKQIEKYAGKIRGELSKLDVDVPELEISFNLDFSEIEQHHQQVMELDQKILDQQDQIDSIETDKSSYSESKASIDMARQRLIRAERSLDNLGKQPSPMTTYERERVKKGGAYSDDQYANVPTTDHSNVQAWKAERDITRKSLEDKESRMEAIMIEEERKTGIRISLDKAQKKYEKEVFKFEKDKRLFEQKAKVAQDDLIELATQKLIKNTAGQLDKRIKYLQDNLSSAIGDVFNDQCSTLIACVDEQYVEPLNAKLAKRAEVKTLLQQSETEIKRRKSQLGKACKELNDLLAMTLNALES
ncbi:hypothetical protein CXF72_13130 [Psychromonas sp. MB-3u-54]|uniref:dynamin family protein n=1 Tax=Psychromonas sp. MB-3u-54 TaxID=2058319 RepID=UPI000C347875|nr:dynamin family protein [Psychromonas sp. MB-3u-54]PKH02142.1 hypothetical protein CXF72_13130 [Psychromonas sp. MB-3u-54]